MIGLVSVSKLSYLITITGRQQVAQILGRPIYVVTQVTITPCSSYAEAAESIRGTARYLNQHGSAHSPGEETDNESSSDEGTEIPYEEDDDIEDDHCSTGQTKLSSARSSVAEDVIRKKGSYGRFAQRWFSRNGWTMDQKRTMGMSDSAAMRSPQTLDDEGAGTTFDAVNRVSNMIPKLLRMCQIFFGASRSFYYSYDVDITRSLAKGAAGFIRDDVPLYSQVENDFFWNRHLHQGFIDAGQEQLVLPIMQGFVGQRSFMVDTQPAQVDQNDRESVELSDLSPIEVSDPSDQQTFSERDSTFKRRSTERDYLITVISRRSNKRAGLRYLRRGIDQNGFVANAVETEQILSPNKWDSASRVYSFLQIRGSIPLFFTQSPYSLKPVPALQHSEETNVEAAQKHFERLANTYGNLQVVNLVEKHGVESKIGSKYAEVVDKLNEQTKKQTPVTNTDFAGKVISFEWFDFHHACRGMKFENVSLLLDELKDTLDGSGSTVRQGASLVQLQEGVVRTNCMDCLDRTNVCQSSFAKHMLELQLKEEGIDLWSQADQQTTWFNTLWADNGDAISKQYASTAAMKGDYTRTRKRDYRGALNDLGLSLARFYSGSVILIPMWKKKATDKVQNGQRLLQSDSH